MHKINILLVSNVVVIINVYLPSLQKGNNIHFELAPDRGNLAHQFTSVILNLISEA